MPADPVQLLWLAAASAVLLIATLIVARRPSVGLWLFAGVALASMRGGGPQLAVSGVQAYPLDAVTTVLGAAVTLRTLRLRRRVSPLPAALLGLVVLATGRGIMAFGTQQALNASRGVLYVAVAVLFAGSCLPGSTRHLLRVWKVSAAVLLVWAGWYLVRNELGSHDGDRALISAEALLVAQAGLLTLHFDRSSRGRWFAGACLAAVVISQQRTVWAATVMMLVLYTAQRATGSERRAVRTGRRLIAAGLVAVVFVLIAGPAEVRERTTSAVSAEAISTEDSTFAWRLESWRYLVNEVRSGPLADQMGGMPMGTPLTRAIGQGTTTASAHNMYVMTLIWVGISGLIVYLAMLVRALRATRGREPVLFALVGSLAVFSIGYQLSPISGLVLGAALAVRASRAYSVRSLALTS